ncbi:MAG: acyl-CoA dehydrogenase [Casimicrobiaceae bacterium]|nr:acyl-CoA dehydrogenase [Casimicrobiaceae bacterium]
MAYRAPLQEFRFLLETVAPLESLNRLARYSEATPDTVAAILEAMATFASEQLDPLNAKGDREGARRLADGSVVTPAGFREAYERFRELGGMGLSAEPALGGLGMPRVVSTLTDEMLHASCLSFGLMPMLTQGAIEALQIAASDELKRRYLPNMVSGRWAGTMNLTEPQAGSDLALIKTRAEPHADGSYRLFGTKIYITYGEHDWTENIIHLVLARTPGAPPGVKGISLFLVPKFLVDEDGRLGARNDVHCVSIEHKLGIHASPTCVMQYGDHGGAIGYLVGEECRGLEYMFIMMNLARFGVGLQGIGMAERAYQRAAAYARERVQSREVGAASSSAVPIIRHPDVRRMLLRMRAQTEAARALALATAFAFDVAEAHPDAQVRKLNQAFVELMIPVVKGWSTEMAQEVTYLGIQVHGGMGYIEDTGAAQDYRDARITTIYEGTTAIQANDLIGRKLARDGGEAARAWIAAMREHLAALQASSHEHLRAAHLRLSEGVDAVERAIDWLLAHWKADPRACYAGSVPLLKLFGIVGGGWALARVAHASGAALEQGAPERAFHEAKLATLRFYCDHLIPEALAASDVVVRGARGTLALEEAAF